MNHKEELKTLKTYERQYGTMIMHGVANTNLLVEITELRAKLIKIYGKNFENKINQQQW